MATLAFPDITPNKAEFSMISATQTFTSELTGSTQTAALPFDQWTANLTFTNLKDTPAQLFRAFLLSLRGRTGRFWCPMFDKRHPDGTAAGAGKVNGAGQTGQTLTTDGWSINQAGLLLPGDYFQVGNEVKMVTDTSASDGAGNATLSFSPPLRNIPADNTDIITVNPSFVGMLADDKQVRFSTDPGRIYAVSLAIVEALDI